MHCLGKQLYRFSAVWMLVSLLCLTGCQRRSMLPIATLRKQFDVTLKACKNSHFKLGNSVLSAAELDDHFAYQKETRHLPSTVLLIHGSSKITGQHLTYLARMMLDYGFYVYYDDDGTLKMIHPVSAHADDALIRH